MSERLGSVPIRWSFLASHVGAMSAFALLSVLLVGGAKGAFGNLVASAWIAAGVFGIATALFSFFSPQALREILRHSGSAWAYAAAATGATPVCVIAGER